MLTSIAMCFEFVFWLSTSIVLVVERNWDLHVMQLKQENVFRSVKNHLIIIIGACFVDSMYTIEPAVDNNIVRFVFSFAFSDFIFYFTHLLLHSAFFYKRIHAIHHTWSDPISCLSALDCSWIEHIYCNLAAFVVPVIVLQPTRLECHVMASLTAANVVLSHSTTISDILRPINHHTLHHKFISCNYGASPMFDVIFGTYYKPFV
jgi:sterol desaturase/sphingolipid hydroxylase (fatty acid hydroxylase superfamily)